jgi:dUTP pyrophosphatase
MEIIIRPIGVVENGKIRIFSEYSKALEGLDCKYIWVLYHFHLADERLKVHPRGDLSKPLKGVFSTRSPYRPNRIGMSLARVRKVERNVIFVEGLDAIRGSPVIDIKPFSEFYDVFGSVLSAEDIRKRIDNEGLIRDYIDLEKQIQPNGFDCTLRSVGRLKGVGKIDFDNSERVLPETEEIPFEDEWVFLEPGVYRAYLNEVVNLGDDIMAIARPRSTLVRSGINVLTAVWDAGYEGRSEVGLEVINRKGVWLKRNARIVQLVFIKLTSRTEGYKGIYKGENI